MVTVVDFAAKVHHIGVLGEEVREVVHDFVETDRLQGSVERELVVVHMAVVDDVGPELLVERVEVEQVEDKIGFVVEELEGGVVVGKIVVDFEIVVGIVG